MSEIDDDDKVFYTRIGRAELSIDKVLTNILMNDPPEYMVMRNIVLKDNEE